MNYPHLDRLRRPFLLATFLLLAALLAPAWAGAAGERVIIRGVPAVQQARNLSCEYAAAYAVTLFWGNPVTEGMFIREVPENANPHLGFRGNIDGPSGGLTDYGIYAEPLVPVLERNGYQATAFYNDTARFKANIRAGNPVVVWLTTGRDIERPVYTRTVVGASFKLVPWEHAVVVYGFDDYGVRLMDVGNGQYYYTDWSSFLRRWSYFDKMSLVIQPH